MDRLTLCLRELNKRLTREACIKIIDQAEKTEAEFADCFTAAVTGDSLKEIYLVSSSKIIHLACQNCCPSL